MSLRVWILWVLFVIRGAFYCTMLPLWEGWDEYAHFAWLQHWIDHGTLPRTNDPVSREIEVSLQLAPLPHELGWIGAPDLTHEQWWALPPAERSERIRLLRAISPKLAHEPAVYPFVFYEAQQPPLYYWIMSIPLRLAASWPIASRVLFIRLIGIALVSLVIPLTWFAARPVLNGDLAVYAAAIPAIAPGLLIDVARIANDDLTLPLVALLTLLLIRSKRNWVAIGIVLGAGLLTKGNLLALIPALAICWRRKEWRTLCFTCVIAIGIAGWWYGRNMTSGHSFTGWMNEVSLAGLLTAILRLNWLAAAQVSAKSFLWFGAWSFLMLKSWIYTVLEAIGLMALIGLFRTNVRTLRVPLAFVACFTAAMAYATLGISATTSVANAPGWYLWAVACPLAILFTGCAQRLTIVLIMAFALVDLYGANAVMMPYYAGLVARNHADVSKIPEALARLRVPVALWLAYIAATAAIPLAAQGRR
ncbi:MAG TPA: glycosyltransferase family 39 protein [Bryobacteraceae bacterium]|nr:glycosyltransferase family 39 protein [Bryobacteraceae bacterium]